MAVDPLEQCLKNKHHSKVKRYLKRIRHRGWRRFCKSLNELKPMYNRQKYWKG